MDIGKFSLQFQGGMVASGCVGDQSAGVGGRAGTRKGKGRGSFVMPDLNLRYSRRIQGQHVNRDTAWLRADMR